MFPFFVILLGCLGSVIANPMQMVSKDGLIKSRSSLDKYLSSPSENGVNRIQSFVDCSLGQARSTIDKVLGLSMTNLAATSGISYNLYL